LAFKAWCGSPVRSAIAALISMESATVISITYMILPQAPKQLPTAGRSASARTLGSLRLTPALLVVTWMLLHHTQAQGAIPGSPPFLKFLTQLRDDAWSQVLLPQLQAMGSVADVAQTCSQLRDLCYSTVQRVNLQSLRHIGDALTLARHTQHLGAHFPACSSVQLALEEADNYRCMPYVLSSLRRCVMHQYLSSALPFGCWCRSCIA
jgi:hypothetical protein